MHKFLFIYNYFPSIQEYILNYVENQEIMIINFEHINIWIHNLFKCSESTVRYLIPSLQ